MRKPLSPVLLCKICFVDGVWPAGDGAAWHAKGVRTAPGERLVLHMTFHRMTYRPVEKYSLPRETLERSPLLAQITGVDGAKAKPPSSNRKPCPYKCRFGRALGADGGRGRGGAVDELGRCRAQGQRSPPRSRSFQALKFFAQADDAN